MSEPAPEHTEHEPRRHGWLALKTTGATLGVLLTAGLLSIPMDGAVTADLQADGYSDVRLQRKGLFLFSFTAKLGVDDCFGSVTKMPGSLRIGRVCVAPEQ